MVLSECDKHTFGIRMAVIDMEGLFWLMRGIQMSL